MGANMKQTSTIQISNIFLYLSLSVLTIFLAGCATSVAPGRSTNISSDVIEKPGSRRTTENLEAKAEQLFVRGMTRAFMGDYRGALEMYEQVMEISPNEPAVLSAMAEAYEGLNELASAVFFADKAVNLAPDNVHYRQQLAALHIRSGDTRNAADTYRTLVERFPNNTTALYELARILSTTGQYRESIRTYEKLLEVVGDNSEVYNELLHLYLRLDDTSGVEKVLKAIVKLEPGNITYLRMLADFYRQQNRTPEAVDVFERILQNNPYDYESAVSLAELYRETGNNDQGDSLLVSVKNMEGASAEQLTTQAASILSGSKDSLENQSAIQLLERALKMDENNTRALLLLGEYRFQTGDYSSAANHFYRVLQQNPRDPTLWNRTALLYLEHGDTERANEVAEEGLILFPGNLELLRTSGYALMESYRNEPAIDRFEEAVSVSLEDQSEDAVFLSEMHSALALLYWRKNDFTRSDSLFELSLTEIENEPGTLNNYAYSLAERGADLDKALRLAKKAVEQDPENPSFLDTLGWIHFKLQQYDSALELITRAADNDSASAAIFEHLGDIYEKLGNHPRAVEYWQQSLDKNPDNPTVIEKLDQ